jgi:hypothetical protein
VEIVDETVIVVPRDVLAVVLSDRARWSRWWPDLEVAVVADLGPEGMRWSVAGPLVGMTEIRLRQSGAAVIVRYVLEADPTEPGTRTSPRRLPDSPRGRREAQALQRRRATAWKATVWALKDEIEGRSAVGRV